MELVQAVAADLGSDVMEAVRLTGGDVANSFRMRLADGRTVFAKTRVDPPAGSFTTEACSLGWLRDAGAVAVPAVLAASDAGPPRLVLEWIDAPNGTRPDEARFGRELARVHRAGAPSFGREDRRTTGSRGLPNDPCETWVEFFAERRLIPLQRLASESGALSDSTLRRLDLIVDRLADLAGPPEPPARVHGDLWAGNRLVDRSGASWLVDPAAHGGHREFDLAMMRLFGGYGAEAFESYDDEFPLAAGWEHRVALHQLAPLIVHAVKFGGGYAPATARAVDALLAGP